ncbi:MAG: 23S rRNA (guanosine(2251)-2'-O)-methyltransferase RlmB [Solirubrobacterales bacterium]|nr:23S rRNA (guanosine(2251)-2'-O)-methyltransferase RlmB [Solirubrobacterales bacterium]
MSGRREPERSGRREKGQSGQRRRDVVYGRNPVTEARRGRRKVRRVWTADDTDAAELTRIAGSPDHQGVVAEVDPYPYADPSALLRSPQALVVALDQVQDPHNLGAICRSAEAAGAAGVVIPERRAAGVTAAVAKASAGAVEHLPVARVRNLADWLTVAREQGAWIYGADETAEASYKSLDFSGRVVLVLGGEGAGIRPRVASACDGLVRIPTVGKVGSLNVSAAASVLLFAASRVAS